MLGKADMQKLSAARVAVFGLGGVGSYVVEALARSGIGALTLVDNDIVSITDINRQLIALHSSLGKYKVDVAKERVLDINPSCKVNVKKLFVLPENIGEFDFSSFDYIADAIDTMSAKIALAEAATRTNTPIISCMGAGNKLDPTRFKVADVFSTSVCPVARTMRRELKKRGVPRLKVVYSDETPAPISNPDDNRTPASLAFVPSVAGLLLVSEIIKDLLK